MFKLPFLIVGRANFEQLEESEKKSAQKIKEMYEYTSSQRGLAGAILKSLSEGVLAVDGRGNIILANPAIEKMFSVIEPEILGKTTRFAVRNNEIADLIESSLKTGNIINREISMIFPVEGNFMALTSPVKDVGAVCVLHDITEYKKLEAYRSEFVANVSHELKTPLTAIRNYAETLLSGALNDQENNIGFINKIEKHAVNLSSLIDDILEISKLESKRELGVFEETDLAAVFHRAFETISEKAKKKNILIDARCPAEKIIISGIEDHIYRAFLNLLDNAINYTDPGGKVTIECEKDNKAVKIIVTDTGIGISPEHLPRLFERFYRVDKARSRDLGGTGLGLAIVKHVMNLHNGSVTVESEEGQGTKFTLVFPVV